MQYDPSVEYVQVEEFRAYIEKEVLLVLQQLLQKNAITDERMKELARHVLYELRTALTLEDLYQQAIKLDDVYSELAPVVSKLMTAYEEKYNKKAVDEVSNLIKNGDYDKAQEVVLKVLKFKGI